MKSTLAHKSSHDKVRRTELTFLSKTSSEDGQNIWNNGLQDTVHHAKKESDPWKMENKWDKPNNCPNY